MLALPCTQRKTKPPLVHKVHTRVTRCHFRRQEAGHPLQQLFNKGILAKPCQGNSVNPSLALSSESFGPDSMVPQTVVMPTRHVPSLRMLADFLNEMSAILLCTCRPDTSTSCYFSVRCRPAGDRSM